mmetsp:Transcript_30003/g.99357  ORF Transcript_30003/g.99357 Transcript_30003/m.99357 type:complete len:222 (-) Transcript_30003:523-1188(-)
MSCCAGTVVSEPKSSTNVLTLFGSCFSACDAIITTARVLLSLNFLAEMDRSFCNGYVEPESRGKAKERSHLVLIPSLVFITSGAHSSMHSKKVANCTSQVALSVARDMSSGNNRGTSASDGAIEPSGPLFATHRFSAPTSEMYLLKLRPALLVDMGLDAQLEPTAGKSSERSKDMSTLHATTFVASSLSGKRLAAKRKKSLCKAELVLVSGTSRCSSSMSE